MINIQIHGVTAARWEPREDATQPRILVVETISGTQAISLFPVRPKVDPLQGVTVEPGETPPPKAA